MNNLSRILFLVALFCCLSAASTPPTSVAATVQSKFPKSKRWTSSEQPAIVKGREQAQKRTAEAETLLQTAVDLYRKGKLAEALKNCTKAATLNPNDFRPHSIAGLVYMTQLKMKSASKEFARAIRLQPRNKELYLLKATADSRRSAIDDAIAASRKALEIDPNYAEAYAMIGDTLKLNEQRRAEAVAAFESALKINPRLFSVYESLGQVFEDAKDEKRAEEVYRRGIAAEDLTCL